MTPPLGRRMRATRPDFGPPPRRGNPNIECDPDDCASARTVNLSGFRSHQPKGDQTMTKYGTEWFGDRPTPVATYAPGIPAEMIGRTPTMHAHDPLSDPTVVREIMVPDPPSDSHTDSQGRHWRWVIRYQPILGDVGPEPYPDWHEGSARKAYAVMGAFESETAAWDAMRDTLRVRLSDAGFDSRDLTVGYVRKFGRWESTGSDIPDSVDAEVQRLRAELAERRATHPAPDDKAEQLGEDQ